MTSHVCFWWISCRTLVYAVHSLYYCCCSKEDLKREKVVADIEVMLKGREGGVFDEMVPTIAVCLENALGDAKENCGVRTSRCHRLATNDAYLKHGIWGNFITA